MTAAGRPIRGGCVSFSPRRGSRCRPSRSTSAPTQQKSAAYRRHQSAPAGAGAGARRRHRDRRIDRDLPLFRGAASGAAAVRTRAARTSRRIEMWNRRARTAPALSGVARLPQHPSGDGKMEVPQVPAWAEANKPRVARFPRVLDGELESRAFIAGDRYSVADITGAGGDRFHEAGQALGARRAHASCAAGTPTSRRGRARGLSMRLTIVGSRRCLRLGRPVQHLLSARDREGDRCWSIAARPRWSRCKARGLDHGRVDGIVLAHLHGDHFGGLPFLLLDAQFLHRRERPLAIAGPPGTRARLDAAHGGVLSARRPPTKWRFPLEVVEIAPGAPTEILGHAVTTHRGGAPVGRALDRAAALRRADALRLFRRYRMDRGAGPGRRRRRPVHRRMLRLCRRA